MEDLRLRFRWRKPPERYSSSSESNLGLQATALVALTALKEPSDAFPPLKGAVGGVIRIWELSQKVKSNQAEYLAISNRVNEFFYMLADVVPDATQLSPDILVPIKDFTW